MPITNQSLPQILGRPLTAAEQLEASKTTKPAQGGGPAFGGGPTVFGDPAQIDPLTGLIGPPVTPPGGTPGLIGPPVPAPVQGGLPGWTPTPVPGYTAPELVLPDQLKAPDPYTGMTAEQLQSDPSYKWRLQQGLGAVEASANAKGVMRTGGTMKDLLNYGQNAASQEYGAADARNRANYQTNWDVKTGAYDRNVDAARSAWDAKFQGTGAEFAPKMQEWQTNTANAQRNSELQFDRDWQKEIYNRDDAYRTKAFEADQGWKGKDDEYRKATFMADDNFRKTVYGTDDAFRKAVQAESDVWKRTVMQEERDRWMAELGAQ